MGSVEITEQSMPNVAMELVHRKKISSYTIIDPISYAYTRMQEKNVKILCPPEML